MTLFRWNAFVRANGPNTFCVRDRKGSKSVAFADVFCRGSLFFFFADFYLVLCLTIFFWKKIWGKKYWRRKPEPGLARQKKVFEKNFFLQRPEEKLFFPKGWRKENYDCEKFQTACKHEQTVKIFYGSGQGGGAWAGTGGGECDAEIS